MVWTDEDVETLKECWNNNESAGDIEAKINKSRCAIIGKVHRLGLQRKLTLSEACILSWNKRKALQQLEQN